MQRDKNPIRAACVAAVALSLGAGCTEEGVNGELPSVAHEALPPASLKLLRSFEYTNSVSDLLGVDVTADLPEDLVRARFSSISASSDCYSDVRIEQFETIALEVAQEAFSASPTPLDATNCSPNAADDACVIDFVNNFGMRIFRRPLDDQERGRYLSVIANVAGIYDGDYAKGVEFAVAAMLQSPYFIYRVELGEAVGSGGIRKFNDYEMASRLSYGLWETTPDDTLLAAAAEGRLSDRAGLEAEVERMLADGRADESLTRFWREHLGIDRLTLANYPKPGATEVLYSDMRAEGQVMAERLIQPGTDALSYLTSTEAALSSSLAEFYGSPNNDWGISTELPANRMGYLTSGVFLASHGHPNKSSPTRRGKFVVERVLCGTVPPPPPGVDFDLPDAPEGEATQREVLEEHRSNPACRSCHEVMDPVGFAFENFDSVGAYRELDNGLPIDAAGEFEGQSFSTATELIAYLSEDPAATRCVAKQAYRNTIGRVEGEGEEPNIDTLSTNYEAEGRAYRTLMREILVHDSFRYANGFAGATTEEQGE